jgi:hypothetical protein
MRSLTSASEESMTTTAERPDGDRRISCSRSTPSASGRRNVQNDDAGGDPRQHFSSVGRSRTQKGAEARNIESLRKVHPDCEAIVDD